MASISSRTGAACIFSIALASGLMLAANARAVVVVINVDSVDDDIDNDTSDGQCHISPNGPCTLRAALMTANRILGDGATIMLPAGTYVQSRPIPPGDGEDGGDLNMTTPSSGNPLITISGASASTIIDANFQDRVLSISAGRSASISGVTFRNGLSTGPGGGIACVGGTLTLYDVQFNNNTSSAQGGGIYNTSGSLTIYGAAFRLNASTSGGGIWNTGALDVTFSEFDGNKAKLGKGGGIYTEGPMTFNFGELTGNQASSSGGAIYTKAQVLADQITLIDNVASSGGGGIFIDDGGSLFMGQSTLSGNSAGAVGDGGGIAVVGIQAQVTASTISGNFARNGGGVANFGTLYVINSTISANNASGDGGGIENSGTANVSNATIVFNQADTDSNLSGSGGGFDNVAGHTFDLRNSVVAGNQLYSLQVDDDCSGAFNSYGRNKYWVAGGGESCARTHVGPGSDTLLDSLGELGPLQDNGGPTWTHALVSPSNMIDGAESTVGCIAPGQTLTQDQRGFPRVSGLRCDIGAYELQDPIFANGFQ